jgi:hypothetical protein
MRLNRTLRQGAGRARMLAIRAVRSKAKNNLFAEPYCKKSVKPVAEITEPLVAVTVTL